MKIPSQSLKIAAIALGAIAVVMAITNPGKDAYLDHATATMATEVKDTICGSSSQGGNPLSGITNLVSGVCKAGVDQQRGTIRSYIDNLTRRQNLVLFTIYTTEIPQRTYTTIGVFGNFSTFHGKT
jgi:hypothetical protein